jgi:RNA polymerase sigma-70 factor (ECF subfamily)
LRGKRVRKLVYASDAYPDDTDRANIFDTVKDPAAPVDRTLAQRNLATTLLAKLSAEERSLIMLREMEGHTVEELAGMTGSTKSTVKTKLFRIRQKMLRVAQHLLPAEPPRAR